MTRLTLTLVLLAALGQAATYDIGPGHAYTTIGAAPWSSLTAGDTVNLYPKTAITAITGSSSTGTTITLIGSAASIPYGSSVWFAGYTGTLTWTTCGSWGSGLYGTATGGIPCSGSTVTVADALNIASGVTVYFTPPYFEKLILTTAGTSSSPIIVQGIADPTTGALPILDSHNATTGPNMNHTGGTAYHDAYGFVMFILSSDSTQWPKYLTLRNMRIQSGRLGLTGFDGTNAPYTYAANSGLRFENVDNVTVSGLELIDNDNGLFGAQNIPINQWIRHLLVQGNHFYRNGVGAGSHQSYLEGSYVTYEQNWYDKPGAGTACSQLKDRSAGTVIRYNLFYPSARELDLVASQNGNQSLVPQVPLTVPAGGFATGATSLTFTSSVTGISPGDMVGLVNAFTGVQFQSITPGNPTILNFQYPYMIGASFVGQHVIIKGAAGTGCTALNGEQVVTALNSAAAKVTINYDSTACTAYTANSGVVQGGWGYAGSGLPAMTSISAVNPATNTLTLESPGLTLGVPAGQTLTIIGRQPNPYRQTFVYGNVFDWDQSLYWAAVGAIAHYGWDTAGGIDSIFDRAGTLYFYDNTIIARWDQGGSTGASYDLGLFQTESSYDNVRADNNLFYVTNSNPGHTPTYLILASNASYAGQQTVGGYGGAGNQLISSSAIGSNTCGGMTETGWAVCNNTLPYNAIIDVSGFSTVTATQAFPSGLVGTRDYHLQAGSSGIGAAAALPSAVSSNTLGLDLTPYSQYVQPQSLTTRPSLQDVGAFTSIVRSPCDINGDGVTNILDVQLAINIFSGGGGCPSGWTNSMGGCTLTPGKIVTAALGSACSIQ